MHRQPNVQLPSHEVNINLAILAIKHNQIESERRAATMYDIPWTTLRNQRARRLSKLDCKPKSKKLTKLEETVIYDYIINLDEQGFAPTLNTVQAIADRLLGEWGGSPVGINWPATFVNCTPGIKTHINQPYNQQWALCEDPEVIGAWFKLMENTKAKYSITDIDSYNFDETGFQMGVISSQVVVTGSERHNWPKAIQPGNCEWVAVIQAINAMGWAILLFIIFKAVYHFNTWYASQNLLKSWVTGVSENGWTTNELGIT